MSLEDVIFACDTLVEFHAAFRQKPSTFFSMTLLESYRTELSELWQEVKSAYRLFIRAATSNEKLKADLGTVKAKYVNSSESYLICLSEIAEGKIPFEKKVVLVEEKGKVDLDNEHGLVMHSVNVPPCEAEVFYGSYLKWPAFRDMFTALYIKNAKLSPVQKLFHLRACTRDHALSIVSKFEITNENFQSAWSALSEHYENKRVLVNSHLSILFGQSVISSESATALKELQGNINDALVALKSYDIDIGTWDAFITYFCATRLPAQTLGLWEESLEKPTEIPTWENMNVFLTNRYRVLDSVADMQQVNKMSKTTSKQFQSRSPRVRSHHIQVSTQCKLCKGSHSLRRCPEFLKMNVETRRNTVRKFKYCYNCLAAAHMASACQSVNTCFHSKGKHHTLLHVDVCSHSGVVNSNNNCIQSTQNVNQGSKNKRGSGATSGFSPASNRITNTSNQNAAQFSDTIENPQVYSHAFFAKSCCKALLATAIVQIRHHQSDFQWRALLDPGSEVSFISEEVQSSLKLPTRSVVATVSGINSTTTATSSKLCSFTLTSKLNSQFTLPAQALVLKSVTENLPSMSLDISDSQHVFDFPLADTFFTQCSKIDLLIGADLYPFIIRDGIKPMVYKSLMAQNTVFGWVILGPLNEVNTHNHSSFSTSLSFYNEVTLNQELQKFWQLEEMPQTPVLTAEEEFCEQLFKETTFRDKTGRFVVSLPLKEDQKSITLGLSRDNVQRQFLRNENRLLAKPMFKKEYDSVLTEYIDLGHMIPVSPFEIVSNERVLSYYMPHHAVMKPDSLTTRVRVVFNASYATSNGKSLNDIVYPGPAVQTDIVLLILNWRLFKYVFNSDIEKMYRQIKIHPDQTALQRIIFRENLVDPLVDMELLTLTFGVACSPYLAIRCIQALGNEAKESYPLAAEILLREIFVDDVLSGAHNLQQALQAQSQLITVLQSAGLKLRKWTSNASELLTHLPEDSILNQDFLKIDDKSSLKTLGILWNTVSDTFSFSVERIPHSSVTTKRSVLSVIARLYDPIGWLAPIIITAKILMQQIWKDGTDWDDSLLSSTEQSWEVFRDTLPDVVKIRIPRWVKYTPSSISQIHGFCDASEKAYSACLYLRVQSEDVIFSHLLWAKSKVAPVNSITLPRLELQGAVILSKMIQQISNNTSFKNVELIRLWTDSTIVLAWLQKHPSSWKQFVANRTAEIRRNTAISSWSHVCSADNPADMATRDVSPLELKDNSLWWNGPSWLLQNQSGWPCSIAEPVEEALLEIKPIKNFNNQIPIDFETDLFKFSSWHKTICVTAYIFRFYGNVRNRSMRQSNFSKLLSHKEIVSTKEKLIILTQQKYFASEYSTLKKNQMLPSKSWMLKLNPFIDANGIIRAQGRLTASTLSYSERLPIILPNQSLYVKFYIKYAHELSLHGEIQLMMRFIRSEYWIPRLKVLIKKCIFECTTCTRYKKHMQVQLMGTLPVDRTTLSRPFTNTGHDFAGPFMIKTYYGRKCRLDKGYVCIFICFATRAIHLELVSDLTSQAFLACFTRFVSRRGTPSKVYSDHGTNFVGASKLLLHDFQSALVHSSVAASHQFSQLQWVFTPPGSPHMGGLWEAGVKSFKAHFRKVAGNEKFTFEEFTTLLCRIECCLNSRPISPISSDVDDIVPLTPGHFLTGSTLLGLSEPSYVNSSLSIMNRWRKLKILHHQLCVRWKEEYLKELHKRYKWKHPERNLQVNDLVIGRNENLPPNEWRLGRVTKVYFGPDKRVRVADVRTQKGTITRSIAKLCVLLPQ